MQKPAHDPRRQARSGRLQAEALEDRWLPSGLSLLNSLLAGPAAPVATSLVGLTQTVTQSVAPVTGLAGTTAVQAAPPPTSLSPLLAPVAELTQTVGETAAPAKPVSGGGLLNLGLNVQ